MGVDPSLYTNIKCDFDIYNFFNLTPEEISVIEKS
jgi:hypothetical protein